MKLTAKDKFELWGESGPYSQEFLFIIDHLHEMIRYPDKIYLNKDAKRGCFCFVKRMEGAESRASNQQT